MTGFFEPYIDQLITGLVAVVLGWLGKSFYQTKLDNADLTKKIQEVYKELITDADGSLDAMRLEIKELKEKQSSQNEEWIKKLNEIEKRWQTKYTRLQTKYNNLLKKLNEYEANH